MVDDYWGRQRQDDGFQLCQKRTWHMKLHMPAIRLYAAGNRSNFIALEKAGALSPELNPYSAHPDCIEVFQLSITYIGMNDGDRSRIFPHFALEK